jgi:putative tryptophan/tyrosine transport system substrate-binding protein
MRRREFIACVGAAAVLGTCGAGAEQGERIRRVGVLMGRAESDLEAQSLLSTTRYRLEELGWSERRNIRIEDRWTAGDKIRLRAYAVELAELKPDVLLGEGTPVVAALQQATRTIPIVFVNANNPIGSGFVSSVARPGGNITGLVSFKPTIGGKWLELLKEIAPEVGRVGLVYNPQTHTGQHFQSIDSASTALAINTVRLPFSDATEIEQSFADFAREPKGGLLVLPDNSTNLHREVICTEAARNRLPAIYPFLRFINSGGLAYYGANTKEMYRKLAEYVDRILRGAQPADLPVETPTKFELIINLKLAKALGLTIPPSVIVRADEVIE